VNIFIGMFLAFDHEKPRDRLDNSLGATMISGAFLRIRGWGAAFMALGTVLLLALSNAASAGPVLTTCADCDGDKFAITFFLDSDNGTNSVYDVSLFADTSGNNLGTHFIFAVALGFGSNMISVDAAMDAAPNGAGNWTAQPGGLSSNPSSAGGCDGSGAFICSQSNGVAFDALAPDPNSATTPYEWTWDVTVPDNFPGGAAAAFASGADVKISYQDFKGHHVSDTFLFTQGQPPSEEAPEPATLLLFATALIGLSVLRRRNS
jgi:hypothetical protein